MLDIKRVLASAPRDPVSEQFAPLSTVWGEQMLTQMETEPSVQSVSAATPQVESPLQPDLSPHPQPQFARQDFTILDGWWDYAIVASDNAAESWRTASAPSEWQGQICVPFSPEAPLSGVNRRLQPNELLWYKRTVSLSSLSSLPSLPSLPREHRCILHFEAVDYACAIYCDGKLAGTHVGGYIPFEIDITDCISPDELRDAGEIEISVCVFDPSDKGVQLRGKQRLERGGIWYTAQSGIWQTVWMEIVPSTHIASLAIDARPDDGRLVLTVAIAGEGAGRGSAKQPLCLIARLIDDGRQVGEASCACGNTTDGDTTGGVGSDTTGSDSSDTDAATSVGSDTDASTGVGSDTTSGVGSDTDAATGATEISCVLSIGVARPHLWSPDDPYLYQIELTFGEDRVSGYCAFRSVSVQPDAQGIARLFLNHQPCFMRGVLDQGYWPDGLMTAPSDQALIFDIQTCKDLGFNMLRKHIKVESARWYYHCDRLGMLVWQDMVCGGDKPDTWQSSYKPTFFRASWNRYSDDTVGHRRGLASSSDAFRAEWIRTCKETVQHLANHPSVVVWVLFNEAWGQFDARQATELVRKLDPSRPIDAVSGWYDQGCGNFVSVHNYFRPLEVYRTAKNASRAFVISEFGGVSCHLPGHSVLSTSYGYAVCADVATYREQVQKILAEADALADKGLAGFVYTQLSDVEEETNGILTYDRRVNKLAEPEEGGGL